MEINNKIHHDEILEFPDNYEEIANLALLNFERSNKEYLNKLIMKDIEKNQNNINENNKNEDEANNNEEDWGDYDGDEEGEKNINNNYQKFEDDDSYHEEEQNNKYEINNQKNKEIIFKNNIIIQEIELIKNKDEKSDKICDDKNIKNNNEIKIIKEKDKFKNKKLSNEEMKKMISKINYPPPTWGRNLSDQEFINKIKSFNNTHS